MKDLSTLSEIERAVILARRAYKRKWREQNPDKVAKHQADFYLRQAEKARLSTETANPVDD